MSAKSEVKVLVAQSVQFFATPGTIAFQAPLSVGVPRQDYRSGWPFLPPGDLPDPGMEPASPALAGGFSIKPLGKPCLVFI